MTTTRRWRHLLQEILDGGQEVRQEGRGHEPRSRTTKELIGYQSRWDMSRPLVRCPLRKLGRKFAAAEPAWILRGDNRLASIVPYAKYLQNFTDDGAHLAGDHPGDAAVHDLGASGPGHRQRRRRQHGR